MSTLSPVAATTPQPARMSSLARIFGAFISPGSTFADIAREPHFVLCWVVQIAIGMGYFYYLMQRVGVYVLAQQSLTQSASSRNMDPATLQNAIATSAKFFHYGLYVAPVASILLYLFVGWIYQGIANFLLGMEAGYKQCMAMVTHAFLPQTLLAVVSGIVLLLMADPTTFHFTNPIGSNPAFFLDKNGTSAFLFAFSTHLDLFVLWTVVLMAIGLTHLGKKVKFGAAFTAIFGLWMCYALILSGITAAFA